MGIVEPNVSYSNKVYVHSGIANKLAFCLNFLENEEELDWKDNNYGFTAPLILTPISASSV